MTFRGGAYTLIDSEIGHNFDDITDINTFQSFGFEQVAPRQFHIMSSEASVVRFLFFLKMNMFMYGGKFATMSFLMALAAVPQLLLLDRIRNGYLRLSQP